MSMIKLSKRLQRIADFVPAGSRVADIGSDHGLLVSYLVLEKIALTAVAGEIKIGPFDSTKRQIDKFNLNDLVSVQLGDGLSVIEESVDVIIIAGMGGALIVEILEDGTSKLDSVSRLILQPNVGEYFVRKWLYANKWEIVEEEIIKEKNRYYELIIAEKTVRNSQTLSAIKYHVGPINLLKRDKLLVEKWKLELKKQEKVIKKINNARFNIRKLRLRLVAAKRYNIIKRIIKCIES